MEHTCRIVDLRMKEVVNLCDGTRLGYVEDVLIDMPCGRVVALVVPGEGRCFGLLGKPEEAIIGWENIERIGDDIILVRYDAPHPPREKKEKPRLRF